MATITYSPTYPVVGDTITLSLTGTGDLLNPEFELSVKPARSTLAIGSIVDARGASSNTLVADYPGEYNIQGFEYVNRSSPPRFDGDPAGQTDKIIVAAPAVTVEVGEIMELPIATSSGHGVTLTVTIVGSTVRAAGLASPVTELSRLATLDTSVLAAVAALVGVTDSTLGTDLIAGATELRDTYEAHRVLIAASVHVAADTTNTASVDPPDNIDGAIAVLNSMYDTITAHVETDAPHTWHFIEDRKNVPVARKARSLAGATVLYADLSERVYERHRVQIASPGSHGAADNTNTLTAPTVLTDAIVAILDYLSSDNPGAPANENDGSARMAAEYGFAPVT